MTCFQGSVEDVADVKPLTQSIRTDGQAAKTIQRIGTLVRRTSQFQDKTNERIAAMQKGVVRRSESVINEITVLMTMLEEYAGANEERLTRGKTKSAEFATGILGWRKDPQSVVLPTEKRDLEKLVKKIEELKLEQLLRRKVAIDKVAVKKHPKLAKKVHIEIKNGEIRFFVKPREITTEVVKGEIKRALKPKAKKGEEDEGEE